MEPAAEAECEKGEDQIAAPRTAVFHVHLSPWSPHADEGFRAYPPSPNSGSWSFGLLV